MKILMFEYVCAGGLGAAPPPAMLRQGRQMLEALLHDTAATQHAVYTLVDPRHDVAMPDAITAVAIQDDATAAWQRLLAEMDAVLVVAPEDADILLDLCLAVRAAGCISMNCTPDAIRLAADKLALAGTLEHFGIATVPTQLYTPGAALPYSDAVIKPRDGSGCEDTWRCDAQPEELDADRAWVVQPFCAGSAVSLSVFNVGATPTLLACNRMECAHGAGELAPPAVIVGGADGDGALRAQAEDVMQRIVYGIPGLTGYFGIDAFWHENVLTVLEINPRLTCSYAGLSAYLDRPDLGQAMLNLFTPEAS